MPAEVIYLDSVVLFTFSEYLLNPALANYLPMLKPIFTTIVGIFFCWQTAWSKDYVFDFNEQCQAAYKAILQLKLQEGIRLIELEKTQHPDNLIPYYLENYIDFFVLFFNEDQAQYKQRSPQREKRLAWMDKGPSGSPYYLFTKAVINFQWATIRIKFGDKWDAGWELRRSFLQIKECLNKAPHFEPAELYYGSMLVALSSIPDGYKWLGNLFGLKGNLKEGTRRMDAFVKNNRPLAKLYREEAVFYYCYLQFHVLNKKDAVLQFIQHQELDIERNHLFNYLSANLYLNNQQAEKAEAVLTKRQFYGGYMQSPVWDLEMGYALLYQLKPEAPKYLERFEKNFKGKFYLKDVLLKLSWWYYLQGNTNKADYYLKEVLKRGSTDTEADQQAQRYAQSGKYPSIDLLQARLLSDGGLHRKALIILQGKSAQAYDKIEEQLEFNYRIARICDELNMTEKALLFYELVRKQGTNRKEYFAARSALQVGMIYEDEKKWDKAKQAYQACLNMKNHEYKNALDQRAKAGLERIKLTGR